MLLWILRGFCEFTLELGGIQMNRLAYLRFRKGDVLAIALVLALAVAVAVCFLPKSGENANQAQIYQNGQLIQTLDLGVSQEIVVEGDYTNTITVEDGKISVTASNCPGEDCVHSSPIDSAGRSIVCLPNAVEVRVIAQTSDVDFVVG